MHDGAKLNPLWAAGNQIPKLILRIETARFSVSGFLESIQQFHDLIVDAGILTYQ